MKIEVEPFLEKLIGFKNFDFNETFEVNPINGEFNLKINLPSKEIAEFEQGIWGAALLFSSLSLSDFLFLFYAILIEKRVVIVSKNPALLSSAMYFICNCLKLF